MLAALALAGCGESTPPQQKSQRQYDKDVLARGERLYLTNCAVCHGQNGEALPTWRVRGPDGKFPPPPLDDSGHAWHHPSVWLKQMIVQGSPPEQGNMPAWGAKLSSNEIDDVVSWITSLWSDAIYLQWITKVEQPKN